MTAYDGPDLSYVNVEDMLRALEVRNLSRSGINWIFSCPGPEHLRGDSRPSARMNSRSTEWMCSSCGLRGNAISFLRVLRQLTGSEALRVIEERYGGTSTAPIDDLESEVLRIMAEVAPTAEDRVPPDESWVDRFAVDWTSTGPWVDYMVGQRGFSPAALTAWQLGYDETTRRVVIPVRAWDGRLVGFKGRAIDPDTQPRYLIVGDSERRVPRYGWQTYSKSQYVFGLDRVVACPMDTNVVLVVEGELNVIALHEKGGWLGVGVAGSEFSQTQADLIVRHCSGACVFFDADGAGRAGTAHVVEALSPYMQVRVICDAPGDAADLSTEQLRSLILGARPHLDLAVDVA